MRVKVIDINNTHPCKLIYSIGASNVVYGTDEGVCRITGEESKGIDFDKWVRKTFNDHDSLHQGNIISNEALFCFDESSTVLQEKTNRGKPQRFRTYSHIVHRNEWYCLTKADKEQIYNLIVDGAELVCLAESGQKHILFKHKIGMWQIEEIFVYPDIEHFKFLHQSMQLLLGIGFTQSSIIKGEYNPNFISKNGFEVWKTNEDKIKNHRGTSMFDFASFMLFKKEVI